MKGDSRLGDWSIQSDQSVVRVKPAPEAGRPDRRRRPRRGVALLLITGAGLLTAFAALGWLRGTAPVAPVRIAVLPFDHTGVEPGREYLADGLAEDTMVSLGMIDPARLIVVGRTSTQRYRGTTKSLKEVGTELRSDFLVEGAVRTEGSRLRLTSRLIRVTDQALVWTQSYERERTSMPGLQLEVSAAIAEEVRVRLSRETRASLERRHTTNADAYDLYIHGRTVWNERKPVKTQRALELYRQAIARDPGYALAWSGIADASSAGPITGDGEPLVARPLARHAAAEALRAGPGLAEAHTSQGLVNFWLEWNWPSAEQSDHRAVALNPGYAAGHLTLANMLSHSGRHAEAAEEMRVARELDPLDPMTHAISSQLAFHARDYSAATTHARKAIAIDPESWIGHMMLGQTLAETGSSDLALASLTEAERLSGGNSRPVSTRAHLLARIGSEAEARAILDGLLKRSRGRYVPPYAIALAYAGFGEREPMFDALDAAYAAHDVHLVFLTVDPKGDAYRGEPRFRQLLDRCGFTTTRRTIP
jgi:TolB-like protein/Flp pilus assembly protein TadD